MPELPEVEVTRLSFASRIAGARILSAALGKPLRWPLGADPGALAGLWVQEVRRRGKYLLIDLAEGPQADAARPAGLLLVHLGMSGSLAFAPAHLQGLPGAHDHFDLLTSRGLLRLHDPRRFGAVVWATSEQDPVAQKLLGGLGVEPLGPDFEPRAFHAALKQRRSAIKQVLLAGDVVVGVGNIYASEALFAAGIRPTVRACNISYPRALRLWQAIRDVLANALQQGGSTLRDFVSAEGQSGYFQLQAMVYDRAGQPCRVCATPLRSLRQGQRSTFFCPVCQRF
jgi:formamidopyrimidine-DNA glycosylase